MKTSVPLCPLSDTCPLDNGQFLILSGIYPVRTRSAICLLAVLYKRGWSGVIAEQVLSGRVFAIRPIGYFS